MKKNAEGITLFTFVQAFSSRNPVTSSLFPAACVALRLEVKKVNRNKGKTCETGSDHQRSVWKFALNFWELFCCCFTADFHPFAFCICVSMVCSCPFFWLLHSPECYVSTTETPTLVGQVCTWNGITFHSVATCKKTGRGSLWYNSWRLHKLENWAYMYGL